MSAGDANATTERATHVDSEQADGQQPGDAAPTPRKAAYANGKPYDELLCTICGLTSCWQQPKNAATATKQA